MSTREKKRVSRAIRLAQAKAAGEPKARGVGANALSKINAAKILQGMEREQKVLEMRADGMTFASIAVELGYASAAGASEAYNRAISRPVLGAEEEQARELSKIDNKTRSLSEIERLLAIRVRNIVASSGKDVDVVSQVQKGVDSLTKIHSTLISWAARRSKLTGIDAPTRSTVSGEVKHTMDGDMIKSQLIASLDALVSQVVTSKDEIVGEVVPQLPETTDSREAVEAEDVLPEVDEEPEGGEGQDS